MPALVRNAGDRGSIALVSVAIWILPKLPSGLNSGGAGAPLHALHPQLTHALDHLLTLRGSGVVPLLAQLLPALGRQLLEATEVLADDRLVIRRQRLERPPGHSAAAT